MKTKLFFLSLALLTSYSLSYASIINIDGVFSDWDTVPANRLAEASQDANSMYTNLHNIKFCTDSNYIYFYLEYSADAYIVDILMNTDGDEFVGCDSWWGYGGYDYLVEGFLSDDLASAILCYYPEDANASNWEWRNTGAIGSTIACSPVVLINGHKAMEGKIDMSAIPEPMMTLDVSVSLTDQGWATIGCLPQIETGMALSAPIGVVADVNGITYHLNERAQIAQVHSCNTPGSVIIPSSIIHEGKNYTITSIAANAFKNCANLTAITIPNSITKIGSYAFSGCSNLSSINIPNSVVKIGRQAFYGCSSLPIINNIRYAGSYLVEVIDKTASSYTIQAGTKWIEQNAFSNCTCLTPIVIPNSVLYIGSQAFSNIFNIQYSGSATGSPWGARSINGYVDGYFVFGDNSKTQLISCYQYVSGTVVIPEGVISVGTQAFRGCLNMTNITIPESVTSFGNNPFTECFNLPVIDNIRYADTYLVEAVNRNLSSYNIKTGTKWIGDDAFLDCHKLTSISIPDGVVRIGDWAFRDNRSLVDITLPSSLISIGEYAFAGCNTMVTVSIPQNVDSIERLAFYNCSALASIYNYAATPQSFEYYDGVFEGVNKATCILYVPEESVELYRAANGWKEFTNIVGVNVPSDINSLTDDGQSPKKILRNDQILILRGEMVYTLQGQKVR